MRVDVVVAVVVDYKGIGTGGTWAATRVSEV